MENERRLAALEEKLELLTDALRDQSIDNSSTILVQGFALEALLRNRAPDLEFASTLQAYVSDFLETNNPPDAIESRILLTMNALLEAAGAMPPPPE